MRWTRKLAHMGEKRNPFRDLVGKPVGKRPLGRTMLKWEDNIKIEWQGVGCIDVVEDRGGWPALLKTVMNIQGSQNAEDY